MRAVVCVKYGKPEGLRLQEIEKPIPKPNEVLIKVHATTVTAGDSLIRKIRFPLSILMWLLARITSMKSLRRKIQGHELAGEIVQVGKDVTKFKEGDQVFGTTTGLSSGSYAEYVCVPQEWKGGLIALKPSKLTYEEAAAIPVGAMSALHILRDGNIQRGDKVLIYGASGSVGTYAIQLAKYFGAVVTGVCSTSNVDLVKSLGASRVIDYTIQDFTQDLEKYDLIFDAVRKISETKIKKSLTENGRFITIASSTTESHDKLDFIRELVEAGHLKPVIDKKYPIENIVNAHRYVDTGHKVGNVIITVVLH